MANDFSADSRVKALWKLDNDALTTDSKGANTLTNHSVTADTTNKREGDAASLHDGSKWLDIADGSLDAGMPLKQGDSVKKGTWCFWFRQTTTPTSGQYPHHVDKWDGGGGKISLCTYQNAGAGFSVQWGYGTGTQNVAWTNIFTVTVNQWYHITLKFDGVARTCYLRVYDYTNGTVTNYSKTNWGQDLRVCDSPYGVGVGFKGQIDEVVVCDDLISDNDADLIRVGTFPTFIAPEPPAGWNDFRDDPDVSALWRFEPGASFLASSIGGLFEFSKKDNPTSDTTTYNEGSGSVRIDGAGYNHTKGLYIADANLPSNFPLKYGNSYVGTLCFRIRFEALTNNQVIWQKNNVYSGVGGVMHSVVYGSKVRVAWMYNSTTGYNLTAEPALSTGVWYHVAMVIDSPNKTLRIRIQDLSTGTKTNTDFTPANSLYAGDTSGYAWGPGSNHIMQPGCDSYQDEWVAFGRKLTDDEIDLIAAGDFVTYTTIEVNVDTVGIDITPENLSVQLVAHQSVIDMWIAALTLAPSGFGISVDTTNILLTMPGVTIQQAITLSTIPIDIGILVALAELVSKRIFPKPPTQRQTQSQVGKRMFPVLH